MTNTIYCLDSSGILDGWRRHYPPDVLPSLSDHMDELVAGGRVLIPDDILKELERQDDDACKWAKRQKIAHVSLSLEIQQATLEILRRFPKLVAAGSGKSAGDPWLIATAQVHRAMVITGEDIGSASKPKIPWVCAELEIPCGRFIDIFRRERWTFSRASSTAPVVKATSEMPKTPVGSME